jgi:hypothetical protein
MTERSTPRTTADEAEGFAATSSKARRFTSEDLHRALFEEPPEPRTLDELKEGKRQYHLSRVTRLHQPALKELADSDRNALRQGGE